MLGPHCFINSYNILQNNTVFLENVLSSAVFMMPLYNVWPCSLFLYGCKGVSSDQVRRPLLFLAPGLPNAANPILTAYWHRRDHRKDWLPAPLALWPHAGQIWINTWGDLPQEALLQVPVTLNSPWTALGERKRATCTFTAGEDTNKALLCLIPFVFLYKIRVTATKSPRFRSRGEEPGLSTAPMGQNPQWSPSSLTTSHWQQIYLNLAFLVTRDCYSGSKMQPNTLTSSSIFVVISHSCNGDSRYKSDSYSLKNSLHHLHLVKAGKTAPFLFGIELYVIAQFTILSCPVHLSMAGHSSSHLQPAVRGRRPGLGIQHCSSLPEWFCGRTISFGLLTNCQ